MRSVENADVRRRGVWSVISAKTMTFSNFMCAKIFL